MKLDCIEFIIKELTEGVLVQACRPTKLSVRRERRIRRLLQ